MHPRTTPDRSQTNPQTLVDSNYLLCYIYLTSHNLTILSLYLIYGLYSLKDNLVTSFCYCPRFEPFILFIPL